MVCLRIAGVNFHSQLNCVNVSIFYLSAATLFSGRNSGGAALRLIEQFFFAARDCAVC